MHNKTKNINRELFLVQTQDDKVSFVNKHEMLRNFSYLIFSVPEQLK